MSAAHAAVVLAAGGSARLGRAKQLLTRDGETLVHRAARLALETSPAQLLVVVGACRDTVVQALQGIACELVDNTGWQQGLGGSLRAAGSRLRQDAASVLVLACDQPALERHHLQALLDGALAATARCAATLHGGAPGVPAVVPRAWFAQMRGVRGDRGFGHRLGREAEGAVFGLHAPELALDVDTPDDVRRARHLGWLDAPAPPET